MFVRILCLNDIRQLIQNLVTVYSYSKVFEEIVYLGKNTFITYIIQKLLEITLTDLNCSLSSTAGQMLTVEHTSI